ncbi:MAG: hypothetical protein WCX23_02905 [Candidatus Paceibacterota bacterium]
MFSMQKSIASLFGVVRDGPEAGSFPMQRRTDKEIGKDGKLKPQSFAKVLQPMAAGKGGEEETPYQILMREVKEELGEEFVRVLSQKNEEEFFPVFEKEYIDKEGDKVKNYNYLAIITGNDLKKIKIHSGAESILVFLKREDLDKIKTTKQIEEKDIKDSDLVMFADQLSALKGVIENLKK